MDHKLEIQSVCQTSNNLQHLKAGDGIQWKSAGLATYVLNLPGGVFQGYANDFEVDVIPVIFSPPLPLIVTLKTAFSIKNYITTNGKSCSALGDPPEIIIDPTNRRRSARKKAVKKLAAKKAAKGKASVKRKAPNVAAKRKAAANKKAPTKAAKPAGRKIAAKRPARKK
jgi:hypothetical protein